ncbi:hypothetical protein NWF32_19370 [Pseudomonas qingdaonensis]|nr:hypothetical protein [Pseudomonas qingdaonensis]
MEDKRLVAADTLELLLLDQHALRAGLEELSLWISQRGSTTVLTILTTLDTNAEAIASGIDSLRS